MKLFFIKDTLKKTVGTIIIMVGLFMLSAAIFSFLDSHQQEARDKNIGFIMIGLSLAVIAPGVMVYLSGVKLSKLEEKLKRLSALIKAYRRISLAEIAKKFSTTEGEAEKLLDMAIDLNLVKGNMDRTTGEFFVSESINEIKKISFCPNCGASLTKVILKGETGKCFTCGGLFS